MWTVTLPFKTTCWLRTVPMSGPRRDGPIAPSPVVEVQYNKENILRSPLCILYDCLFDFPSSAVAGKQYLRYGCRRKVDSKMVHKSFCNKSNMKPRGDTRDCNQKPCPPPMYALYYISPTVKSINKSKMYISHFIYALSFLSLSPLPPVG